MRNPRFFYALPLLLPGVLMLWAATRVSAQSQPTAAAATATASPTSAQSATAEMKAQANDYFQRRAWAEAAAAYAAITGLEPANAGAWARLGLSLHALGKYREAIAAEERSLKLNDQQPMTHFNLARAYARLNDGGAAFSSLGRAMEAGFSQPDKLRTETDFLSLRDDARFKQLVSQATVNARPCAARPEYRQLDFWIGEWEVSVTGQNQPAGTSSIQLILGDCVIFENWSGASGTNGKSFSFFNGAAKRWQQTWVDDKGGLLEFAGEYKDGAMRFNTSSISQNGVKTMQRMTLFNLAADRMRQLGEQSTDEGKTWSVSYDLTYTRRK